MGYWELYQGAFKATKRKILSANGNLITIDSLEDGTIQSFFLGSQLVPARFYQDCLEGGFNMSLRGMFILIAKWSLFYVLVGLTIGLETYLLIAFFKFLASILL